MTQWLQIAMSWQDLLLKWINKLQIRLQKQSERSLDFKHQHLWLDVHKIGGKIYGAAHVVKMKQMLLTMKCRGNRESLIFDSKKKRHKHNEITMTQCSNTLEMHRTLPDNNLMHKLSLQDRRCNRRQPRKIVQTLWIIYRLSGLLLVILLPNRCRF